MGQQIRLFGFDVEPVKPDGVPWHEALEFPFGAVVPGVQAGDFDTTEIDPEAAGTTGDQNLIRWKTGKVQAELLICPVQPHPDYLSAGGSLAMIWRVRALAPLEPVAFVCNLFPSSEADAWPDCGEDLDAQTWRIANWDVSLGTEDGEVLSYRALRDELIPPRHEGVLDIGNNHCTEHGLSVPLPSLAPGETVQVHFILAWQRTEIEDENDISTWFAVDMPWHRVLDVCGLEPPPASTSGTPIRSPPSG